MKLRSMILLTRLMNKVVKYQALRKNNHICRFTTSRGKASKRQVNIHIMPLISYNEQDDLMLKFLIDLESKLKMFLKRLLMMSVKHFLKLVKWHMKSNLYQILLDNVVSSDIFIFD